MTYKTRLEEIAEALCDAEEGLGEITTQYRSEVSLYGDAWPGAAIDVEKARRAVEKLKAEYAAAEAASGLPSFSRDGYDAVQAKWAALRERESELTPAEHEWFEFVDERLRDWGSDIDY